MFVIATAAPQCDQILRGFATLMKILKSLAIFWGIVGCLAKLLTLFGKNVILFGQCVIVVNGQILKNNLATWSHWLSLFSTVFCDLSFGWRDVATIKSFDAKNDTS